MGRHPRRWATHCWAPDFQRGHFCRQSLLDSAVRWSMFEEYRGRMESNATQVVDGLSVPLAFTGTACASAEPDRDEFPPSLPCDEPAQEADLGSPIEGDPPATLSTNGRRVWATIGPGGEGGFFPDVDRRAELSIGLQQDPPTYPTPSSGVENETVGVTVYVDRFSELGLAAGDYWAFLSKDGDLKLYSCEPDVISGVSPG